MTPTFILFWQYRHIFCILCIFFIVICCWIMWGLILCSSMKIVVLWDVALYSLVSYECYHEVPNIKSASLCWYHEGQKHKDSLKCGSGEGTIHTVVNVLEFHVGQFRALLKTIIQSELVSDCLPNPCFICCTKSFASLWISAKKIKFALVLPPSPTPNSLDLVPCNFFPKAQDVINGKYVLCHQDQSE